MIAMDEMQPSVMDEIKVVAMLDNRVRARAQGVGVLAMGHSAHQRVVSRVLSGDRQRVLIHMVALDVVQMSIMEVVHMAFMGEPVVPAVWAMGVGVRAMHDFVG